MVTLILFCAGITEEAKLSDWRSIVLVALLIVHCGFDFKLIPIITAQLDDITPILMADGKII